jgi:hypothetical protein
MEFDKLSEALREVQANCIGLARIHSTIELVMEQDEHTTKSIWIGDLFGMHEQTFPTGKFPIILFPDGQTMGEMMTDPNEFADWLRKCGLY